MRATEKISFGFVLSPEDQRGFLTLKRLTKVSSHVPADHCRNLPELRENGAE